MRNLPTKSRPAGLAALLLVMALTVLLCGCGRKQEAPVNAGPPSGPPSGQAPGGGKVSAASPDMTVLPAPQGVSTNLEGGMSRKGNGP